MKKNRKRNTIATDLELRAVPPGHAEQTQERVARANAATAPPGFTGYVNSMGFRLDELSRVQYRSLLRLFNAREGGRDISK